MWATDHSLTFREEASDRELVVQILSGNSTAFAELVHRYEPSLYNFAYHILKDEFLAYDLLQHVFLQLHLCLPSLRGSVSLKPWLFRVARNGCIDELRKQRHRPLCFSELHDSASDTAGSIENDLVDTSPSPHEGVELLELQETLLQAIENLPPRYRTIVLLRLAQYPYAQIGKRLGIPEPTVKTYFHRARRQLSALGFAREYRSTR